MNYGTNRKVDRLDVQAPMAAAREDVETNIKRFAECESRLATTREMIALGRSERQRLHDSALGRLHARLESLPVIEQAKGILVARTRRPPEEAFEILRRSSQRTNVRIRDLAADLVARTSAGDGDVSGD
jgi:hypothetical protein